ncbi:uncharacterized GMC-type oxidoreductase Mb1310-like, partial [Ornithodoros turicata]|uniref:uncharacterized GMC-type oxidoreductase Mb1310-like n=1 Tax=Ornithodoros turicata TaxID=34597 RepID=UPI00313962D3
MAVVKTAVGDMTRHADQLRRRPASRIATEDDTWMSDVEVHNPSLLTPVPKVASPAQVRVQENTKEAMGTYRLELLCPNPKRKISRSLVSEREHDAIFGRKVYFKSRDKMDVQLPYTPKSTTFQLMVLLATATFTNPPPDTYYDRGIILPRYDYIIVGGGTAGCVLANKLSEDPNITVLVIEAGKAEDATTEIPLYTFLHFNEHFDWKYRTVPQKKSCLSIEGKKSRWTSGKALGGSSVLNFMIVIRGNSMDYDHWEELGATGWAFKDVLPYFKDVENFMIPEYVNNVAGPTRAKVHNCGGQHTATYRACRAAKAALSAHRRRILNINSSPPTLPSRRPPPGQAHFPCLSGSTEQPTHRLQSLFAFAPAVKTLQPAGKQAPEDSSPRSSKPSQARPEKEDHTFGAIILNGRVATGVMFEKEGRSYTVNADQEVILSAGAVRSPQLLMVSGIGPRKHLESLKIPVIAELPVGDNLMDHVTVGGIIARMEADADIPAKGVAALMEYIINSTGPYSVAAGVESLLFPRTKYGPTPGHADAEIAMISVRPTIPEMKRLYTDVGVRGEDYDAFIGPHQGKPGFQLFPFIFKPKSRGIIRLASPDLHDFPLIDPRYYTHPEDIKVCVAAVKAAVDLVTAKALREDLGAKIWDIPFPSCKQHKLWSDCYMA